jgi:hypothetical protein
MRAVVFVLSYMVIAVVLVVLLPRSIDPLYRAVALFAPAIVLGLLLTWWGARQR